MLKIYKASAGSGKTFQLVVEYLRLLLENPQNYRHILAVTFTNKATAEMKSRILEQLNILSSGQPSNYIAALQNGSSVSETAIRQKAGIVLKNILHDYNRFSISTIDSFTQRIIKSFNREMGISPNYQLELNSELVLAEATDRLLDKISNDKKLLDWLADFSREKIEENQSQRIENDVQSLGNELFKENFQLFFPDGANSVYNRENLETFHKELSKSKAQIENSVKAMAKSMIANIEAEGFTADDFSYKKSGIAGYIYAVAGGGMKEPGARVMAAENEPGKWYAKHPEAAKIHSLVETKLLPALRELLSFYRKNEKLYYTILPVIRQMRMLGILTDLKEEISALLHEKGVLQLSDANLLLSKIIANSDSPFIYEKTGSWYKHFMLDEFQDTSGLQWNNFRPLIANSLAEGNNNLIVGDVKQSIYRWRNSDWRILAEQLHTDFNESQIKTFTLEKNWRSDLNIIRFNNNIFKELIQNFETVQFSTLGEATEQLIERFRNIYDSLEQIPGNSESRKTGLIEMQFVDTENFEEDSAKLLVEQVKKLQDGGIKASETAILIRKNREGIPVINAFLEASANPENANYNLSVLSNESLFLFSSQGVLTVINVVEYLVNPGNPVNRAALANQYINWLKPLQKGEKSVVDETVFANADSIFENEIARKTDEVKSKVLLCALDEAIIHICSVFGLFEIETELPYLQTLIDCAADLKSSHANDLSGFLFWWNETGYKTSVSVNEDVDSIRLLTVHKSKGLEYKAVLIPFFNWKINESGKSPVLWCRPKSEPFNKFPLLPVKSSKALMKSDFRDDFLEEISNALVDILNLVYVAFTRAKSALIVNAPQPAASKNTSDSLKPIEFILKPALEKLSLQTEFTSCWNEENQSFSYGGLTPDNKKEEKQQGQIVTRYAFNDVANRVKLRKSDEDLLVLNENRQTEKNHGKLLHEILSAIKTETDIEKACLKAMFDGKISVKEMEGISAAIKENFKNPVIADWFSTKYKVLNERSLISGSDLFRPDRIMISGNNAIVVDYKTGIHKSEKYQRQVSRYAGILRQTGFEKVEGYIWYTQFNEVEKVCQI